ncbi:MAG: hypothetical protein V4550_18290 [Gemmatimonadota bacterium]
MSKDAIDRMPPLVGKFSQAAVGEPVSTVILAAITLAEYCSDLLINNPEQCKGEPAEMYELALIVSAKLQAAREERKKSFSKVGRERAKANINRFVFKGGQ